jgi:predicted dehydrogenase
MSKQKLKLGIIGMGRVAMAHADATKALKEQVKLVAIAELRAERAKEMAEVLGVKKVYSDYRELHGSRKSRQTHLGGKTDVYELGRGG